MAKHLNSILKKYSDVISGKVPASKVGSLSLGDQPGVDYAPKSEDERNFVASHSVELHPDRNGNGDEIFGASKVKMTDAGRHGHIPSPKDAKVYKQANEETELDEKYMGFKKTEKALEKKGAKDPEALAAWIGRKKYGKEKFQKAAASGKKLKEAKDEGEYGYEGDMAVNQLKTICRHAEHLVEMLTPDTDLPEWVQSKITLAEDYVSSVHNYLMSEMDEETLEEGKSKSSEPKPKLYADTMKAASKFKASDVSRMMRDEKARKAAESKEKVEETAMCESCGKSPCECDDAEEMPKGKIKGKKLLLGAKKALQEKAESVAQQKLMAMALAYKRGDMPEASAEVKKLASSMTEKQLRDYAKTKHEGLPQHVQKEQAPAVTPITFPVTNSREGFKL